MLTQSDLDKLLKFVGMFGSSFQNEAGTAAQKANDLVKSLGIDWKDLLTPKAAPKPTINVNVGGKPANGTASPPPPPPQPTQAGTTRARTYGSGGTARGHQMAMWLADFRHRDVARDLLANHRYAITSQWETDFINDMAASIYAKLHIRQAGKLQQIASRAGITL